MKSLEFSKTIRAASIAFSFPLILLPPQAGYGQNEQVKGEAKIEDKKKVAENALLGNISAGRAADRVGAR